MTLYTLMRLMRDWLTQHKRHHEKTFKHCVLKFQTRRADVRCNVFVFQFEIMLAQEIASELLNLAEKMKTPQRKTTYCGRVITLKNP